MQISNFSDGEGTDASWRSAITNQKQASVPSIIREQVDRFLLIRVIDSRSITVGSIQTTVDVGWNRRQGRIHLQVISESCAGASKLVLGERGEVIWLSVQNEKT